MSEQRTEKPTQKACKSPREGQFPPRRTSSGRMQFFASCCCRQVGERRGFAIAQQDFRWLLLLRIPAGLARLPTSFTSSEATLLVGRSYPLPLPRNLLGITLAAQLGSTNLGISFKRLTPESSDSIPWRS